MTLLRTSTPVQESNIYDVVAAFWWPSALLLTAVIFRKPLTTLLHRREIRARYGALELVVPGAEAENALQDVFAGFLEQYDRLLRPFHRKVMETVLRSAVPRRVDEVIEGFDREDSEHIGCLRALRGLGLVVPEGGGAWRPEARIEVTGFGRSLTKYLQSRSPES